MTRREDAGGQQQQVSFGNSERGNRPSSYTSATSKTTWPTTIWAKPHRYMILLLQHQSIANTYHRHKVKRPSAEAREHAHPYRPPLPHLPPKVLRTSIFQFKEIAHISQLKQEADTVDQKISRLKSAMTFPRPRKGQSCGKKSGRSL